MGAGVGGVYLVRVALGLIFLSPCVNTPLVVSDISCHIPLSLVMEESEPSTK